MARDPEVFDVCVIGAGAAGMMCAAVAGRRGLSVVLVDHAPRLAEKIRISGGGRCNFTNLQVGPENFLSENPNFSRSALSSYGPADFIALVRQHGIAFHEKHKGQLFCDESSQQIIDMLKSECDKGGVHWRMPWQVEQVRREQDHFELTGPDGQIRSFSLVVATGGMALPQVGASDFALKIARQFGHTIVEPRPALVPLTFDAMEWARFSSLSGVSLQARIETGEGRKKQAFVEDMLFTHRGLSGPGILQISSYWKPGTPIQVDLAPGQDLGEALIQSKPGNKQLLSNVLGVLWPRRLADCWLEELGASRLADLSDKVLRRVGQDIHAWSLTPKGTEGYKKAEVMSGGVDTKGLNQRSLESKCQPGLYFIGEAVDVTGWLGGYNFQWAWSSGVACGKSLMPG